MISMRSLSIAVLGAAVGVGAQEPSTGKTELRLQARLLGSGSPVVLLGGGLLGAGSWGRLPSILATTHQVITLQSLVVEYGLENRALPTGYSLLTEVEALGATLDALGVERADIIGMSHGALTALLFGLERPGRVRTLTLIEPPAFWVLPNHGYDDPEARAMQQFVASLRNHTITEAHVERFRCLLGDCAAGRSPRQAPQWSEWTRHRNSLRGLHTVADHADDPARLRQLVVPTLVVAGADTVAFHRAINAALVRLLPRAEAFELRGGHNSPASAPEDFLWRWKMFRRRSAGGEAPRPY